MFTTRDLSCVYCTSPTDRKARRVKWSWFYLVKFRVHIARYLSCLVNGDGCHLPPSRCTCCPLIFAWCPHCLHGSSGCVQKRLDRRVEESRALTPEWKCRTPRPPIKAISYRLKRALETLFRLIWLFGGSVSFWTRWIGLTEVLSNDTIYRVMFVPIFTISKEIIT